MLPVRTLNVFVLAMLSLAVVISLRNLPLTASYGLHSLFYYGLATLVFMIPYALISAELASGWPKAGGVFIWVREALGDRMGFFAIWMQWFHNVTWYPAMLAFIGAALAYLINPMLATNKFYLITVVLVGFWGITIFNLLGVRTSAWFSTICVIIGSILPALVLILFALLWLTLGDRPIQISFTLRDIFPPHFQASEFAFLAGILLALAGLEANANLAREVKHPQKNYPRAILVAAILTLLVLVFGSLAIAIVIPKAEISLVSSLLEAFHLFFLSFHVEWLVPVIALLTLLGALGELNAWAIAGVKGLFVTTEHGLLPPFFHKLNRHFIPARLLYFQGIVVTLAALLFLYLPNINTSYWVLSALSAQMYLLMYLLLFIAAVVLRYTKPHVPRLYRIPGKMGGIWILALLGSAASLFAFIFSFVPPQGFETGNLWSYELLLIGAIGVIILIPLLIYAFKKPEWQREVLQEIRADIHKGEES